MRLTGKRLNEHFNLGAMQARYRENGVWFHPLQNFPAVLIDGGGYLPFPTKSSYMNSPYVKHGPDPNHIHVYGGISHVPGYISLSPAPASLK